MIYSSIGFSLESGARGGQSSGVRRGHGRDPEQAALAMMREAMPVLRDGPSPEQVQAWVELAYLVVDDDSHYRNALALRLEVANGPRTEWNWQLLSTINGWPLPASLAPVFVWSTQALRAHSRCWWGSPIRRSPGDPDQLRPGRLASVPGHRSRCDTCHRSNGFRTGQSFSYSPCVRRYRWLWKSCAVASAVAFPMGTLVAVAYDSIVLGAMAAVLLGDAVILGIIAIRGGVHPTLDEGSRQPCSCGPRS